MKRIFLSFIAVSSVCYASDSAVMGGVATMSSPMVPQYSKPVLPPEKTKEEEAKEDPTKQVIKSAGTQAGVLLGTNLLLKGFSTKYQKEACLSGNTKKTFDELENGEYYFAWNNTFTLKKNVQRCIQCCPKKDSNNNTEEKIKGKTKGEIATMEKDLKKAKQNCETEYPGEDNKRFRDECLDKLQKDSFGTMTCSSEPDDVKICKNKYDSQMAKHCSKKNFKGMGACKANE
ncbi:MAG: hypothetical protein ACTSUM_00695 [Alphaproteobacteria bacterium]|nr:MAG: hypothetical protein B6I23_00155 [Rickettsiaceae bacterium 4572_127]